MSQNSDEESDEDYGQNNPQANTGVKQQLWTCHSYTDYSKTILYNCLNSKH